tara:strand:- start:1609 stop:2076 length:468 start_codon:yes stop_codon:yes gene_type:complete
MKLKDIISGKLFEAKMTPAKLQKVQRDLIKTIDALKKNFPLYKAAKESGDEKKLKKHRDIALKLTQKKKDLELDLDKALGGLYQDAELELKEASFSDYLQDKSDARSTVYDDLLKAIPDSYGYKDFALDIANIIKDEYGSHNIKPFLKELTRLLK